MLNKTYQIAKEKKIICAIDRSEKWSDQGGVNF